MKASSGRATLDPGRAQIVQNESETLAKPTRLAGLWTRPEEQKPGQKYSGILPGASKSAVTDLFSREGTHKPRQEEGIIAAQDRTWTGHAGRDRTHRTGPDGTGLDGTGCTTRSSEGTDKPQYRETLRYFPDLSRSAAPPSLSENVGDAMGHVLFARNLQSAHLDLSMQGSSV